MRNPRDWIILFTCFFLTREAFATHEYKFTLADIEPYVIRGKDSSAELKGLQVELLQILAKEAGHRISFVPIPTRRYLTAAFKPTYDGAIYSDLLFATLPVIREKFDVIEPVFGSRMFLFRKSGSPPLPSGGLIPEGTVGQVGDSCGTYIRREVPHLKTFDIKDPEQGVLMLNKDRLDYLCLSNLVVYRLMHKLDIPKSNFEILRDLGQFQLLLLLRKDLPEAEKSAFRESIHAAIKKGLLQELFERYQVSYPKARG